MKHRLVDGPGAVRSFKTRLHSIAYHPDELPLTGRAIKPISSAQQHFWAVLGGVIAHMKYLRTKHII